MRRPRRGERSHGPTQSEDDGLAAMASRMQSAVRDNSSTEVFMNSDASSMPTRTIDGRVRSHRVRLGTLPSGMPATASPPAVIGLIGHPVSHSLLPCLQQAALNASGLPFRYEAWDTEPEELAATVASLRSGERKGATVCAPYNRVVGQLLDVVTDAAQAIGSVNTIARQHGRLVGYNTDVLGFTEALRIDARVDVRGLEVAVLGGCGSSAARAVVYGLLAAGAGRVWIHTADPRRTRALVEPIDHQDGRLALTTVSPSDSASPLRDCAVIVHATTLGMPGGPTQDWSYLEEEQIPRGIVVFDLAADPVPRTKLLAFAEARGCRTFGAETVLLRHAAVGIQLWTDRVVSVDVMHGALAHRRTAYVA
jgi:shikimate dehydrogenase